MTNTPVSSNGASNLNLSKKKIQGSSMCALHKKIWPLGTALTWQNQSFSAHFKTDETLTVRRQDSPTSHNGATVVN